MPERPNVVWVFGDQHRAQATGFGGDPNVATPNIDRLAAFGAQYEGIAGCPLCCPYRGSLLSGRYPHHSVPGHEHRMPPEQPTVAHAFSAAGYQTAWFGKWHVDGFHESEGRAAMHIIPPERRGGFERWIGYENNNSQWDCWVHGRVGGEEVHYRLPGYETDALTDLLLAYLREPKEKPFFAALSVQPPHDPYAAPERFMARHAPGAVTLRPNVPAVARVQEQARRELAGYYAAIENLDWNLGRIVDALRETGLLWDTHILFFSDHGDMHGSHGQFRKTTAYEESIRVPFLVGGGRLRYDGHRIGRPGVLANHVDVAPTSLGLCGIETPDWMEGTDLSGFRLEGRQRPAPPDSAFLQSVVPTGHGDSVNRPWRGVVTADGWKYVCFAGTPWLLFDLNEDPCELANLAHNNRYRTVRLRLQERLRRWVSDTGDRFDVPSE